MSTAKKLLGKKPTQKNLLEALAVIEAKRKLRAEQAIKDAADEKILRTELQGCCKHLDKHLKIDIEYTKDDYGSWQDGGLYRWECTNCLLKGEVTDWEYPNGMKTYNRYPQLVAAYKKFTGREFEKEKMAPGQILY